MTSRQKIEQLPNYMNRTKSGIYLHSIGYQRVGGGDLVGTGRIVFWYAQLRNQTSKQVRSPVLVVVNELRRSSQSYAFSNGKADETCIPSVRVINERMRDTSQRQNECKS